MSYSITKKTAKIIGLLVAVVMLVGVVAPVAHAATLTEAQISSILNLLSSFGADQATIDNVNSALRGQPTSGTGTVSASVCPYTWTRSLTNGSTGSDVKALQQFLNSDSATQLASSGPGSPGNETSFFGSITRAGVVKFQNKYAADVLAPVGLSAGTGYFGPSSRAHANSLCTGATAPGDGGGVTTPAPTPGTGLTVSLHPNQPSNSIAPIKAARVPFTKVNLTAGTDGPVTVNSLTVELNALADDTDFDSVALMNEDGTFIGTPKSFGSNDRASIGTAFVIPAGATKTVVVAGNIDGSVNSGATASINVVGVNTSATVSGSLPIVGATHTLNDSISIGSATAQRGSLDPGTADGNLEVGSNDEKFAGIKITAGSNEDLLVKSIRWEQTGSASSGDLENVHVLVLGTEYTAVNAGDYYTAVFSGDGLSLDKGSSMDFTVIGDVVGGSTRTIDFDIDRREDIHIVGKKFGYGIRPDLAKSAASADSSNVNNTNNPYYDASEHTVSAGTIQVSSWTGVGSQNIAVNLLDEPLAGWSVDVKGEPVTVESITFNFTLVDNSASSIGLADLTNVKLVDENGSVLAGPVDGSGATTKVGTIKLTDTITFPTGVTNLTLKGKLGTDFASNDTIAASTTPSTDWSDVSGDVTGDSITPSPSSAITGSTMTVKAASLSLSVSGLPISQTVIAGSDQFEFSRIILDAGNSGEDIRLSTLPIDYATDGSADDLTNCKLYDGGTAVTTGGNVANPSSTGSSTTFTFDGSGLVLTKGTAKTLSVKCDVKTGTTAVYELGLSDQTSSFTGASGITSGQTVVETFNESAGPRMTAAASGSFTVSTDNSVLYRVVQAGSSDVTLAKFRFEADTTEDLKLKKLALQLGATASNTPADLVAQKVTIWNGSTKVGEAQFGIGTNGNFATSTLTTPVPINRGDSVTLTLKGDLTAHDGIYLSGTTTGAFIQVDWDGGNNGLNGNYATGVASGQTIGDDSGEVTTTDQTSNGVRVHRNIPTLAEVTNTHNPDRDLAAGSDLYAFRVDNSAGDRDIIIYKVAFDVLSSGLASTNNWQLYGPSGAVNATGVATSNASTADVGGSDAAVGAAGRRLQIIFDADNNDRLVEAGSYKDYRLQASTISTLTANNTESVNIALLSDTAHTAGNTIDARAGGVEQIENSGSSTDRFIWSPTSTTTSSAAASAEDRNDWTNSYGLPGFPGVGQNLPTRVFTH